MDDRGVVKTNMAYRVQHNNAIGPYKGGIRFHESVNLSILKFLAFIQTFKNSLTTLPIGRAKGGSDFSAQSKSDSEIMRFCQAYILELWRHIGPETDIPEGDIGVVGREVAYMYGLYRKLAHENAGTFTGKGLEFGGSLIRPEATGYGNIYLQMNMLKRRGIYDLKGQLVAILGSGNVATYTAEKVIELGGKIITMSDSSGYIYDPNGIDTLKLAIIFDLKNVQRDESKNMSINMIVNLLKASDHGQKSVVLRYLPQLKMKLTKKMQRCWYKMDVLQFLKGLICH